MWREREWGLILDSRSGSGEAIDARRPSRTFVKIEHRESDLLLPSYSHQSVLPMLILGRGGRGGRGQLVLVVCVNRRPEKCRRRRHRFTRSHAPDPPLHPPPQLSAIFIRVVPSKTNRPFHYAGRYASRRPPVGY